MGDIQSYLLYYFIIFFTSIVVAISEKCRKAKVTKHCKVIFWISLFLPVFISAVRYGIGTDYFTYEKIYFNITQNSFVDNILNTQYEPGWVLLNKIVEYTLNDVQFVFVISALIVWIVYFKAVYEHRDRINISIAILILLATMYNLTFNNIRQPISASILLLSIKPIIERKQIKFYIITLIAVTFHYTALIFLPVYWLINGRYKSLNIVKKILVLIIVILLLIYAEPIFSFITEFGIFSKYSEYNVELGDFGVGLIIFKLPVIFFILFNIRSLRLNHNPINQIVVLYFIGVILDYFSYLAPYAGRISMYFLTTQILIIPAIIHEQKNKYIKFLFSFGTILYYIMLFTYKIIILNNHDTIPFNWLW